MTADERETVQCAHDMAHGLAVLLNPVCDHEPNMAVRNMMAVVRNAAGTIGDELASLLEQARSRT